MVIPTSNNTCFFEASEDITAKFKSCHNKYWKASGSSNPLCLISVLWKIAIYLKFMFSKKATKIDKIFTMD